MDHSLGFLKDPTIPFSLEHHSYSSLRVKTDRLVYLSLLLQGLNHQTWVVRADLEGLSQFYQVNSEFIIQCLIRLKREKLLIPVYKAEKVWVFHAPILKEYIQDPSFQNNSHIKEEINPSVLSSVHPVVTSMRSIDRGLIERK